MRKFECDRCGKETSGIDSKGNRKPIDWTTIRFTWKEPHEIHNYILDTKTIQYELCVDCTTAFRLFVTNEGAP